MGMDLLLNYIYWNTDEPPKWDEARKYIESLTVEQLQQHPEYEYMAMIEDEDDVEDSMRQRLIYCHDRIVEVINTVDDRQTFIIQVGKYTMLITGGDSWGDSPSDMFDYMQDWLNIEGLDRFGFYPDHKMRAE